MKEGCPILITFERGVVRHRAWEEIESDGRKVGRSIRINLPRQLNPKLIGFDAVPGILC
jgi:hypothetical protein